MLWLNVVSPLLLLSFALAHSSSDHLHDNGSTCQDLTAHPDRMTTLPGWNQPLPSPWFSGYLEYEFQGQKVHTHYVLIEAEQIDDDPVDKKPLIYWSNGGPGASSLFGLMTELGPLLLSDDSLSTKEYQESGIPTPLYNPYSWTRLGSLLIIDQPAPVGFSFCNDETKSHNCGDIKWTDELTSLNVYTALQAFYETKFPCLKSKELYLTGESYGGIYIPTFARRILDDQENSGIDLKGFAVGDGCLGTKTSMCGDLADAGFVDYWHILFMAGHHQIPISDFQIVMKACHHSDQTGFLTSKLEQDDICRAALKKTKKEIGGFFTYSLYNDCPYRNGLLQGGQNDYPCGGGVVLEEYLKLEAVHEAFGVTSDFFETDNAEGDFDYTPTEPDLTGFYKEINGKLKVLIYNGDTDPAITSFAAQNWTSHLGFSETQHWRPWTIDSCRRMGGYVTRYEGNFDFLTIRGAGHMVPTEKPEATFTFIQAWMNGVEYPSFDPNCTLPDASGLLQPDGDVDHEALSMLRG